MTTYTHTIKVLVHPDNYGRPLGRFSSQSTYHIWCALILAGSGAGISHICMFGAKYYIFLSQHPIWSEGKDGQPQKARGPANNVSHGYSWQFNDQCIDKAQSWYLLVGSFYYLTLTCNQHRVIWMQIYPHTLPKGTSSYYGFESPAIFEISCTPCHSYPAKLNFWHPLHAPEAVAQPLS